MEQSQFLDVIDRDEAERRFHAALDLAPLGRETVGLDEALGRVLAQDLRSGLDVPGFTRSNVDGFAVCAADSFGCDEENPRALELNAENLATGVVPTITVEAGTATPIATGGVLPRGADAVVMVEHTRLDPGGSTVHIHRAVAPGAHLTQAGADIARGETVLRTGTLLTSRETGVLASLGNDGVTVYRRPKVAIFSTGDEIIPPGRPLATGQVYDANATVLADAVREMGCEAHVMGIVPDDEAQVEAALRQGLAEADVVLLSGGTSKGAGDVNARVVARLESPGILAHGVALKPGKPICLAASGRKPVVILPGFPTSAVFTFHEFVAPVLRAFAGRPPARRGRLRAVVPARINSEIGRTEYTLVALVRDAAVPLGKGSGSVTAFGVADGFITISRQTEYLEAGEEVDVTLLGRDLQPADLVIQGSHCLGLDLLLGEMRERGLTARLVAVGSTAGLAAVAAGRADLAGIHLYDAGSGDYNRPFLPPGVTLLEGYGRMQGILFRRGDRRFARREAREAIAALLAGESAQEREATVMINRNRGSGTRVLIDEILGEDRPSGFFVEARSHHAVAAAIAQNRADWGVAIEGVAGLNDLGFLPLKEERFDFAVAAGREGHEGVMVFAEILADEDVRHRLREIGFLA
jgi:putative molybdopterin biosynthesis protein